MDDMAVGMDVIVTGMAARMNAGVKKPGWM